jgi:hypothetical protein
MRPSSPNGNRFWREAVAGVADNGRLIEYPSAESAASRYRSKRATTTFRDVSEGGLPLGDRGSQPTRTHVFRTLFACGVPQAIVRWSLATPCRSVNRRYSPAGSARPVPSRSGARGRVTSHLDAEVGASRETGDRVCAASQPTGVWPGRCPHPGVELARAPSGDRPATSRRAEPGLLRLLLASAA